MLVSPHASLGERFFEHFPEILSHPGVTKLNQLFLEFISIEADLGASNLAHDVAQRLQARGVGCLVFEMDYPRAIVDGGRVSEHCLRNSLPSELASVLEPRFAKIHHDTLDRLAHLHQVINKNQGILLDLHTMASFSPMKEGKPVTEHVSFASLESYVAQFKQAPRVQDNLRAFDLITEDGQGNFIADEQLANIFRRTLREVGIEYRENSPYAALEAFLMNTHMSRCKGVAIDIPKHLIAVGENPLLFDIGDFKLDEKKLENMSELIAGCLFERTNIR